LDVIRLEAAVVEVAGIARDEGETLDGTAQRDGLLGKGKLELDAALQPHPVAELAHRVGEGRESRAFLNEAVEVEVRQYELLLRVEACRLGEQDVVLIDQRMPIPGQVRGGLAGARCRVEVRGGAAAGVGGAELASELGLADGDVAGREVEQHRRSGE